MKKGAPSHRRQRPPHLTPTINATAHSGMTVTTVPLGRHGGQVSLHHIAHQRVEAGFVPPAELGSRFARISEKKIHFGRPVSHDRVSEACASIGQYLDVPLIERGKTVQTPETTSLFDW